MKRPPFVAFAREAVIGRGTVIGRGATIDGSRGFQPTDCKPTLCPCRGATIDGSRGFQPTDCEPTERVRRGATIEPWPCANLIIRRRSATQRGVIAGVRGLKPTATIRRSLRDESQADLNLEDVELAKKIQRTFEGLGI